MRRSPYLLAGLVVLLLTTAPTVARALETQSSIATRVCQDILGAPSCSSIDTKTLWITTAPFDDDHVVRDWSLSVPDMPFPSSLSPNWLVVIDDNPFANFGHPVRWLFVSDDPSPTYSSIFTSEFIPTVWDNFGAGPQETLECTEYTTGGCAPATSAPEVPGVPGATKDCLHAVLISGGINDANNHGRYGKNLRSMYTKLRDAGYPAANTTVYYDNGLQLDLDNADGDNDDTTGSDITGNVAKNNFRTDIQNFCQNLDPTKDILVIYTSNHGTQGQGLNLWDFNGNGKIDANEVYTPAELAADTKNCNVCHLFIIMDQCHSGDFTPLATDGNHANTSVYTAAAAAEPSVCRLYMNYWEKLDLTTRTIDNMHATVAASMAGVQKICTATVANPNPADFCELCKDNGDCASNSCQAIGRCSVTTGTVCFANANCPLGETCVIPDAANSTPQKAEGSANNGNITLNTCCAPSVPTPTPTATPPLRHYDCYEAPREPFPVRTVTLTDMFGTSTVQVLGRKRICNPASKNGEDPDAVTDPNHLTGYIIKQTAPKFTRVTDVTVTNQFGTVVVDLTKPDYLMLPAAKDKFSPPGPLVNPQVDHFKCYKARRARTRVPGVQLDDQFTSLTFDVRKPIRYCVAVDKNGEGIINRAAALMCYKGIQTSLPKFRGIDPVFVDDQFGADETSADHLRELCVPSPICIDPTPRFRCTLGNLNAGAPCTGQGVGGGCDRIAFGDNAGRCVGGPVCAVGNANAGVPCGPLGPGGGCDGNVLGDGMGTCAPYTFHADFKARPVEGGWSVTNTIEADCLAAQNRVTAGTLGAFVFDPYSAPYILSNNHVLGRKSDYDDGTRDTNCRDIGDANSPNEPLEPAMQPGTLDGGVSGDPGGPFDIAELPLPTGVNVPPTARDPYEPLCMRGVNCPGAAVCLGGLDSGDDCAPPGIGGGCDAVVAGDNAGLCVSYPVNLCNESVCVDASTKNCIDASIAKLFSVIPAQPNVLDVGGNATFGAPAGPLTCKDSDRLVEEANLIGEFVCKSGRSSGFTCGVISGFTAPNVSYADALGVSAGRGVAEFVNQLEIRSLGQKFCQGAGNDCQACNRDSDCPAPAKGACIRAFSCPGDSGSVVFLSDTLQPVGLLFSGGPSGGEDLTFANPIKPVLTRFGIHF